MPSLSGGTKIKMRQVFRWDFGTATYSQEPGLHSSFAYFGSFWGNLLKAKLFIEYSIVFINTLDHNFIPHLQVLLRTIFVKGGPNWMLWMNWIFKELLFQWWPQKRPILLWCHYIQLCISLPSTLLTLRYNRKKARKPYTMSREWNSKNCIKWTLMNI